MRIATITYAAIFLLFFVCSNSSCKKDKEIQQEIINDSIKYDGIAKVKVENYVNRLFIDLIGREPTDVEMQLEVSKLESQKLTKDSRLALITKLQTDKTFIEGDSSYFHVYHYRLYELHKARTLEGASEDVLDGEINLNKFAATVDSIAGNWDGYNKAKAEIKKLEDVKYSYRDYREKKINICEVYRRMLYNSIYDLINMNSFNFINAAFDNLFFRYPTQTEFNNSYQMVEYNNTGKLFGSTGTSKDQFTRIVTTSNEFYEGMVVWTYKTLLARNPTTQEMYNILLDFKTDNDFYKVQQFILITDEYANF